tara:strand:+ start:371 stop:670 length:300 start_codon:yes stop_codon:yes gene_type:complete
MNVTVIHEKCDLEKDNNTKLPYTSYVIQYEVDGKVVHDIAMAQKAVDIFDHYYDKYKKGFKWLKQSNGTQKPNLWKAQPPQRKKKKRSSAQPPQPPEQK